MPKIIDFAVNCVRENENFDNVIFTDESNIKIQTTARRTLYKVGKKPVL